MTEIILKIIQELIWPATIIIIILILRKPISDLIPLLKKLKYKDLEVEFEKEALRISAKIAEQLPPIPKEIKESENSEEMPLFSIRQRSIKELIEDSSLILQRSIFDLGARSGINFQSPITAYQMSEILKNKNIISENQFNVFNELAILRNEIEHSPIESLNRNIVNLLHSSSVKFEEFLNNIKPSN